MIKRLWRNPWLRGILWTALFFFLSDNIIFWMYGNNWARNYMSDPECLWTNMPGSRRSYENPQAHEFVNEDTLRRSHPAVMKKKVSHRVLFIGCSYTFGVGVDDKDTFVWRLNEMFPNIEFTNGGVPGYGALRCGLRLNHLLERGHYDLVIYPALADHPQRDIYPMFRRFDPDAFLMPYTELGAGNVFIDHPPFALEWWGDRYYGPINILKKRYIAYLGAHIMEYPTDATIAYIYAHQINSMALATAQRGTRFAVLKLDKIAPDSCFPHAESMFSAQVGEVEDVAFPHELTERYRVLGNMEHHPNEEVHAYWAEKIAAWIRETPLLDEKTLFEHRDGIEERADID